MLINENNEYETGDDADPNDDDDGYTSDGAMDAFASAAPIIVVSP